MEHHAKAVDAIAQAGRLRAVVENMTEMPAAATAMHFGPQHPEGAVLGLAEGIVRAADKSSASRCRSRISSPRRTAAGRSRRRRRRPCAFPSGAGSIPVARCRACAGFHIAAASAARAIPHRSFRPRISRRPAQAWIAASGRRQGQTGWRQMRAGYGGQSSWLSVRGGTGRSLSNTARAATEVTRIRPEFSHFLARVGAPASAAGPEALPPARRGCGRRPGAGGPAAAGAAAVGLVPACRLASARRASRTPFLGPARRSR